MNWMDRRVLRKFGADFALALQAGEIPLTGAQALSAETGVRVELLVTPLGLLVGIVHGKELLATRLPWWKVDRMGETGDDLRIEMLDRFIYWFHVDRSLGITVGQASASLLESWQQQHGRPRTVDVVAIWGGRRLDMRAWRSPGHSAEVRPIGEPIGLTEGTRPEFAAVLRALLLTFEGPISSDAHTELPIGVRWQPSLDQIARLVGTG